MTNPTTYHAEEQVLHTAAEDLVSLISSACTPEGLAVLQQPKNAEFVGFILTQAELLAMAVDPRRAVL